MSDIRFAFRQLARSPGFAGVAIFSLALALGANSAVFTIVDALFLEPVIPERADQVVNVYTSHAAADRNYRPFSYQEFLLLRRSGGLFADVAAFRPTVVGVSATKNEEMRRRFGFIVSDNYFTMLGARPVAGRFFLPEESEPGAGIPVAVASHAMWERHGGGADFIGRTVFVNGTPCTIVGVSPRGFSGGNALLAPEIWLPLGMSSRLGGAFGGSGRRHDLTRPDDFALHVMARLRPDETLRGTRSGLPAIAARLTETAPDRAFGSRSLEIEHPSRFNIDTEPSSDGPLVLFGVLLLCMSGVVLLVACLNLANMFLARGTNRVHELSLRLALGASRRRVVRLLFAEGLLIAFLGGALGILFSYWADTLLLRSLAGSSVIASAGFSLALDVTPDASVLLATLIFCMIASLIFSVAPALRLMRHDVRGRLSLRGADYTTTDRWGRLFSGRHCLLMAQLGLCFALLFSGGLFFRAAHAAANLDPGFKAEGDLVAELDYSLESRAESAAEQRVASTVDALRRLPGVRQVALASSLPYSNVTDSVDVSAEGVRAHRVHGNLTAVSAGYFQTIGVAVLRGRDFTEREWRNPVGPPVAVIDEHMAASLFPNEDPIGRYLLRDIAGTEPTAQESMEIVGIVSAHRHDVFADESPPRVFVPLGRESSKQVFVHLRTDSPDTAASDALRRQVREALFKLDAETPLVRLAPFTTIMEGNLELWALRFAAGLFGVFGLIALTLAVTGVYGVKAFLVARRTREIGIRMALGAQPREVLALFMRQGVIQIAVGLGVGLLLSLAAGRLLASMLLRVSSSDLVVLVAAALPLFLAALLAAWLPARRATRINPVDALNTD